MVIGPAAACTATAGAQPVPSNVTLRNIGFRTAVAGAVDLVISRPDSLPASFVHRFPAMPLPAALISSSNSSSSSGSSSGSRGACVPLYVQLHSAYFQSSGGLVILGLNEGDMVTGSLWDGNMEILDSDHAVVVAGFMSGSSSGVVVGRVNLPLRTHIARALRLQCPSQACRRVRQASLARTAWWPLPRRTTSTSSTAAASQWRTFTRRLVPAAHGLKATALVLPVWSC